MQIKLYKDTLIYTYVLYIILGKYKIVWLLQALLNNLGVISFLSLLLLCTELPLSSPVGALSVLFHFPPISPVSCYVAHKRPLPVLSLYFRGFRDHSMWRKGCLSKRRATAISMHMLIRGTGKIHRVPPLYRRQQATIDCGGKEA